MKKQRDRIISFILAIVLCISCIAPFHVAFASARASGTTAQGVNWSVTPAVGGGYELRLDAGTGTVIPSDFFDDPTLSQYKDTVKTIVIGSGITAIQDNAFLTQDDGNGSFSPCAQLKTVKFEEGSRLTAIGAGAFSGCENLMSVNLEVCTQLTTIGGAAADAADVTAGAFYNTGLTQVTIPASVNEIGDFAFYGCTALENVNFEVNTNPNFSMGAYVFAGCTALEAINPENLQNADLVFGTVSSVTIGSETVTNGNGLFYGCTALKSLVLPDMSGSIAYLCKGCSSLTALNLDSCAKLECNDTTGNANFLQFISGCGSLQELDLSGLTGMETLWQGIIGGNGDTIVSSGVKKVILPPSLTRVASYAFAYNNIEEVVFTKDENGISRLANVGGTTIDDGHPFASIKKLREIDLQFDSSKSISKLNLQPYAFTNSPALEKLTISSPAGLNILGPGSLKGCSELRDFVWDVKSVKTVITWDSYINNETSSDIRFRVGPNVQKLPSYMIASIADHVSEYAFAPGNSFYIDGAGGGPFTAAGCYYADAAGNLYRLNDDNTAELVYASRSGSGTLTIPAMLSATYYGGSSDSSGNMIGEVQNFTVTKVGSNAFEGTLYSAVSFEAPQNITALADNAFAGAYKLSSVNECTTEEEIKNTFSSLTSCGNDLYKETKIIKKMFAAGEKVEPGTSIAMNTDELVTLSVKATSSLAGIAPLHLATGETAEVTVGVADDASEIRTRVYAKVSDPANCVIPPEFLESSVPGVFYYDVPPNTVGGIATYSFSFSYPNNVAPNKQIALWLVESETEEKRNKIGSSVVEPTKSLADDNGTVIATASTQYLEVTWDVLPEIYGVTKAVSENVSPTVRGNNPATLESLSYLVTNTMTTRSESIGADYVDHVEYVDTLTLPEGLSWRTDLSSATFTCEIFQNKKGGRILAQTGDAVYTVCTLNLLSDNLTELQCSSPKGQALTATWTISNEDPSKEISGTNITVTYGPEVIVVNDQTAISADTQITNTVDATPYYTYNGKEEPKSATVNSVAISVSEELLLTKEWVKKPAYMGEEAVYRITAENVAEANKTDKVEIYDRLDTHQYIDAVTIQTMLQSSDYDSDHLTVEIRNALLMPVPASDTVMAVDGATEKAVSVSDTAKNPLYDGRAAAYAPAKQNVKIIIQKKADDIIGVSVDGTPYTVAVTAGETLQALFDKIGYVVSAEDDYVVHWDFEHNTVSEADTHKEYVLTARVKNSLQSLTQDMSVSKVAELQNPGSYTYNVSNSLYASAADCEGEINVAAKTDEIKTRYDLSISKTASVNGAKMSTTELSDLLQNSSDFVVEYKATVSHYGSGAYGLLPVVDHMEGIQAVLAEVGDNQSESGGAPAWADYAEIKNIDGKDYYILNANNIEDGKEYVVYEGVWLENGYAASITVRKTDSGLDTLIKWYYYDDTKSDYTIEPVYKAICSQDYAGNTNTNLYRSINNEVWVNDLPTHRLWDCIGAEGTVIAFDKQIVTKNWEDDDPDNDTVWSYEQPYPISDPVGDAGTTVTYRMGFENYGSEPLSLSAEEFYDLLPETGSTFTWNKDHVKIFYKTVGDGVSITYDDQQLSGVSEGSEYEIVQGEPAGAYKLQWSNGFVIQFPPQKGAKAYIYVQLTFPTGETWSDYVSAKGSSLLYNTLFVHGVEAQVSHTLPDKGEAMLRKGVYETGYYVFDQNDYPKQYFLGADRLHYVKTASGEKVVKNTVTYFVTLYNSSDTANLYLSTIYDRLPEGFAFYSLVSSATPQGYYNPRSGCVGIPAIYKYNVGFTWASDPPLARPVGGTLLQWWVGKGDNTVSAKVLSGDNQNQMLAFDVITEHQDERGYYLKPGEALQFGYMCFTGNAAATEAVNTCAMEYLDYSLSEVELSKNQDLTVSDINGLSPENNGKAELWNNAEAAANGFTATNLNNLAGSVRGNDSRQWLASSVSLSEGNIKPDIDKSVESYAVQKDNPVNWTVTSYNNGNNSMTGYTVEDVMDRPFVFTGQVGYAVSSLRESVEWVSGGSPTTEIVSAGSATRDYLFNIQTMDETGVTIVSNRDVECKLQYNIQTTIEVSVKRLGNVYSISTISVCFTETGDSVCMRITFPDSVWSIPANGSGVLTLSTVIPETSADNVDGVYDNKARLTPDQAFDSAGVTHGQVEGDSVVKQAPVSIYSQYASAAYKEVWEAGKQDTNYGVSPNQTVTGSPDYILLDDKAATFTYRLNVSSEIGINQLVLIDNLPQTGDVSPVSSNGKAVRRSEFQVDFAAEPHVVVEFVTKTGLDESTSKVLTAGVNYTVEYSDKANTAATGMFDKTTDWRGLQTDGNGDGVKDWGERTANSRSIRIVINEPLPEGTIARVSFDAVIAEGGAAAAPGAFAWNNFGYDANVSGDMWLYSAPSNVGVGIPEAPSITKKLVDRDTYSTDTLPVPAKEDQSFRFLIYEGEEIPFTVYAPESMTAELDARNRKYTFATVTVAGGQSAGELVLDPASSVFDLAGWTWEADTVYTIVEAEPDSGSGSSYTYGYIEEPFSEGRSYTFTYQRNVKNEVVFANTIKYTTLSVNKTVTGSMGDRTKYFTFTLDLTGNKDYQPKYVEYTRGDATVRSPVQDGKAAFMLRHGETIVLNVPVGLSYRIYETDADGYETTYQLTETVTGQAETPYEATNNEASGTTKLNTAATVAVVNNRDVVTPVSADTNIKSVLSVMALVLLLASVYAIFRIRHKQCV